MSGKMGAKSQNLGFRMEFVQSTFRELEPLWSQATPRIFRAFRSSLCNGIQLVAVKLPKSVKYAWHCIIKVSRLEYSNISQISLENGDILIFPTYISSQLRWSRFFLPSFLPSLGRVLVLVSLTAARSRCEAKGQISDVAGATAANL